MHDDFYTYDNTQEEMAKLPVSFSASLAVNAKTQNVRGTKKHKKNKGMAIFLAVNILLSVTVGFGGGWMAGQHAQGNAAYMQTQAGGAQMINISAIDGRTMSIPDVAAIAANSVVEITTETMETGSRMQQFITEGAGSGVIISNDGYIVTNSHVLEGARSISVQLRSGATHQATLIGSDTKTDLAVIKINNVSGLQAAVFGDSDELIVGETAIAIGNPLGQLGGTVTNGIISALDREIVIDRQSMTLLQTNAAINPGNSGGGLFNERAQLIGIVNAKSSGTGVEGLGFAIPSNTVKKITQELIKNGYVTGRVQLGVSVMEIANQTTAARYGLTQSGLYVYNITVDSSAQRAGIKHGDFIVSIDGKATATLAQLSSVLGELKPGDSVPIVINRDGQSMTVTAVLLEEKPA